MSTEEVISIEGTLLMLDDVTPHVAVPVQVVQDEKVVATTLSNEKGKYQFVNLKPGVYQVRCQILGGYVYYGAEKSDHPDDLKLEGGKPLENMDFRIAPFKKGIWRNYTYMNGLAHNSMMCAGCVTRDGMMWIATVGGGVIRYDGRNFVNLTTRDGLACNEVCCIYADTDGVLWFGTIDGVSRYDGEEFVNLTTRDGSANNYVTAIHQDMDGVMWFGTGFYGIPGCGVFRYDGKELVSFTTEDGLAGNTVLAINHTPDGVLWFGSLGGLSRYDGEEFKKLSTQDGLIDNRVNEIHADPDGTLWIGTRGGVSRYDEKGFANFTVRDGLVSNSIWNIHRDDGILWFAAGQWIPSGGGGVSRYDGKTFVNFTEQDGIAGNAVVQYTLHDSAGFLWLGKEDAISRYDNIDFLNLTTKDGLADNWVMTIHHDSEETMWFGTKGGVSLYDGVSFDNFTTEDGLAGNFIWDMCHDSNGNLWFATFGGGISRYDGRDFTSFTAKDGFPSNYVMSICCDSHGIIWFGVAPDGVCRYDGKEFVTFTKEDGLAGNVVQAIQEDADGNLWFGTRYGGVSCYDGKEFRNFTEADGLVSDWVSSIYHAPDGILWFGTKTGICRYDGKEFLSFGADDGLNCPIVAIHTASDNTMWFGTQLGGVFRYDGVTWSSLDMRDGLASNWIWSIHEDADGTMWFTTTRGITRYRPSKAKPKVRITSIRIGGEYMDLEAIPSIIVQSHVFIEYSSIDFRTVPEKRQYRCRIQASSKSLSKNEIDIDWRSPMKATQFEWIPERPGEYTFQVQAIDRDLNYSEPVSLKLTVQPDPVLLSMQEELGHLRQEAKWKYQFENIIGNSYGIRQVRALMEKAIDSRLAVLITGETGTGKDLVAKAIHYNSPRKDYPLLTRNCGAIARDLLASDLFGHIKGAFTGADADKMGLFEAASGGTVLLDEIGEMTEAAQTHLLGVLQDQKIQRIGENQLRDVDVRIIAITNRNLEDEIKAGRFREDLYYRLSVFPIHVPPLRERADDIPLLAKSFLEKACQEQDRKLEGFASEVMEMLMSYSWPGNIRELEHEIARAVALAEEDSLIQTYHFSSRITRGESLIQEVLSENMGLSTSVERLQRRLIENALKECGGNRTQAAQMLQVHRPNFIRLMKRLGIE